METIGLFSGVSLVEGIIYAFIGSNMLLTGTFLIQRGVQKFTSPAMRD